MTASAPTPIVLTNGHWWNLSNMMARITGYDKIGGAVESYMVMPGTGISPAGCSYAVGPESLTTVRWQVEYFRPRPAPTGRPLHHQDAMLGV